MYIGRQERAISFSRDDEIAGRFTQSPHHGVAVALMFLLIDEPGSGLCDLRFRVTERIVVNHHDLVDHVRSEEPFDDGTNAPFFVIGRYDHTDRPSLVHDFRAYTVAQEEVYCPYLWPASRLFSNAISQFRYLWRWYSHSRSFPSSTPIKCSGTSGRG